MRKRTRWKMHEIHKAIGIFEHYQRARENARYSRERLGNETEALKWDDVAVGCLKEWEDMGLGDIVPDLKRIAR